MRWTLVVLGFVWVAATGLAQGPAGPIHPKPRPTAAPRERLPPVARIGRPPVEESRQPVAYQPPSDPVLVMAIEANKEFDDSLPNFVCNEFMTRSSSHNLGKKWKDDDVVEAEVLIVDGHEDYRDIKIDGKPTGAKDLSQIGGAWSMGEYSTVSANLFAPASRTQFTDEGADTVGGRPTRVYRYKIEQQNSHWTLHINGREYTPGHNGKVWIDPENGRALRVEMEATLLPYDYPLSTAAGVLQYDNVEIDGKTYLLPSMAENTGCLRGSAVCTRLHIDYRDYQKFSSESTLFTTDSDIDFGQQVPEGREPQPEPKQ